MVGQDRSSSFFRSSAPWWTQPATEVKLRTPFTLSFPRFLGLDSQTNRRNPDGVSPTLPTPGQQPLCRARWRLGRGRFELDGQATAVRSHRGSSESSYPLSASSAAARGLYRGRTGRACPAGELFHGCLRLCVHPGDSPTDARVRSCRLAGWAGDVDLREVSGLDRQQR